jgi:hypothetical protein
MSVNLNPANPMKAQMYSQIVQSCLSQLSGPVPPNLPHLEKWCSENHGLAIGGKATEAAFDALQMFGLSADDIRKTCNK